MPNLALISNQRVCKLYTQGWIASYGDLDWEGLDFTQNDWNELMKVDGEALKAQALGHEELFLKLWDHKPKELL
jgi:phosphoenolpyruvate carboxykinase (GTP)